MAYASLLESTSPSEHKKHIGKHRAIVEDSRFWKLAKEKSPKVNVLPERPFKIKKLSGQVIP